MEPEMKCIQGIYTMEKMRNQENGFTVFLVRTSNEKIVCTGKITPPSHYGAKVRVTGKFEETKYGKQLNHCILQEIVTSNEDIYRYLMTIKSIGIKTAEKIALKCDAATFLEDAKHPEKFAKKADVSLRIAKTIQTYIVENEVRTKLAFLLSRFSSGYHAAERIFAKYGKDSIDMLYADPFGVCHQAGLSFWENDAVAAALKIGRPDDSRRINAGVNEILSSFARRGDCCVCGRTLVRLMRKKINNPTNPLTHEFIKQKEDIGISGVISADVLIRSEDIIQDNHYFYSKELYWQETQTAAAIRRIVRSAVKRDDITADKLADYAQLVCTTEYAPQQRDAFQLLLFGGLGVLTGGPGTGKTTVVKGIIAAYEKIYPGNIIKLCAPTGRASQRMKEATGREACTIHRLIEYRPYGDTFACKDANNPIEADLIIVDESSMISIDLSMLFFNAVKSGTMILLVGDTAQLPSVGAGNVLADIIDSGIVPVIALTETYRQKSDSSIIENATRIHRGISDLVRDTDFQILESVDNGLLCTVQSLYAQYHRVEDPFAVQVLTLTRRDPIKGCHAINRVIQMELNKLKEGGVRYGDVVFYQGDKIMTIRNNYNIGYFNGDIGTILSLNDSAITVNINGETIDIPRTCFNDITLSYATTIHKSQGSEYDVVIVVLADKPMSMLQRNILYTAITRAKKRVILIASDRTIHQCVITEQASHRVTGLTKRLKLN